MGQIKLYSYILIAFSMLYVMLAYSVWKKGKGNKKHWFALHILFTSFYLFGYGAALTASSTDLYYLFIYICYLGVCFVGVFWLFAAFEYTDTNLLKSKKSRVLLIGISILLYIIMVTNRFHYLYYPEYEVIKNGEIFILEFKTGLLYWLTSSFILVENILGTIIFIIAMFNTNSRVKKTIFLFLLGFLFKFIFYAMYLSGITLNGSDITPIGYIIALLFYAYALFKEDLNGMSIMFRNRIFEKSGNITLVTDEIGKIIDQNIVAGETFGDIIGKNISEIINIKFDEIKSEKEIKKENRYYRVAVSEYNEKNSNIFGYIFILTDITELMALRLMLEEQNRKNINLLANQKKLLQNISHELRTPLNGIKGMAQLNLINDDAAKNRRYLNLIIDSSDHLVSLINNIILSSKTEIEFKTDDINLEILLSEVKYSFEKNLKDKEIFLFYYIQRDVKRIILSDEKSLKQILINLIGNAIKFTKQGGIFVNVYLNEEEESKQQLNFKIKDTGIGIEEKNLDKIFTEFYREEELEKNYEGSGLGLSITKNIIKNLGGDIEIKSKKGVGTEVIFNISLEGRISNEVDENVTENSTEIIILSNDNILNGFLVQILSDYNFNYYIIKNQNEYYEFIEEIELVSNQKYIIDSKFLCNLKAGDYLEKAVMKSLLINEECDEEFSKKAKFCVNKDELCFRDIINYLEIDVENENYNSEKSIILEKVRNIKVLVVEDNPINLEIMGDILQHIEVEYESVSDYDTAKKRLENFDYDLIFLDIQLKGKSGFDVAKYIKKQGKKTKVIAVTASLSEEVLKKIEEQNFDDTIEKPFDIALIHKTILKFFPGNVKKSIQNIKIGNIRYLKLLVENIESDRVELQKMIINVDYERIEKLAHLRKGSAFQIEANELGGILEKLEISAMRKNIDNVIKSVDEIYNEIDKLETKYDNFE